MEKIIKTIMSGTWVSPCYYTLGELIDAINTIQAEVINTITANDKTEEERIADETVGCPILFDRSYPNLTEVDNYNLFDAAVKAAIGDDGIETPVFAFALLPNLPYSTIAVQIFDGEDDYSDDLSTFVDVKEMFFDDPENEEDDDDGGEED